MSEPGWIGTYLGSIAFIPSRGHDDYKTGDEGTNSKVSFS